MTTPDPLDRELVLATQAGLPLVPRPYREIATRLGVTEAEIIARMQAMLTRGVIRRIAAVPNHYALGMTANGMSVWDVADDQVAELGARIGDLPFVSHCYQRPRKPPQWPYNLFAMVHGTTREEVLAKAAQIRDLLGTARRADDILFSTRILKKTGLRLADKGAA